MIQIVCKTKVLILKWFNFMLPCFGSGQEEMYIYWFGTCFSLQNITGAHMLTLKNNMHFIIWLLTSLCHSSILLVFKINTWAIMLTCIDFKHFVSFVDFLVSNISRKVAWSERQTCFWFQKRAPTLQCIW